MLLLLLPCWLLSLLFNCLCPLSHLLLALHLLVQVVTCSAYARYKLSPVLCAAVGLRVGPQLDMTASNRWVVVGTLNCMPPSVLSSSPPPPTHPPITFAVISSIH